jgi:transposase, IS5 family
VAEVVMAGQPGFFDLSDRYDDLSAAGDPLERMGAVVDFEVFRGPLMAALRRSARGKGGRPPFDPVLMFKVWVLQALYSLSDEATEFQIKDRLSFQRFLGLGLDGTVPDATTCGCSASAWSRRRRSTSSSLASMRRSPTGAISPWVGRSST